MLDQIQRDLFALGARARRSRAPDRRARRRRPRSATERRRAARSAGSTRSRRSCRRCAGSSSPAARRPARCCTWRATVCRRAERAMVALGADAVDPIVVDLRQPAVRPAVRHGARGQPARGRRRNRVVARRGLRRAACAWRAQHYENFPVASRLLPAAMRPHIAAIYAFARIADDFADEGDRTDDARLALLDDWRERLHARRGRRRRRPTAPTRRRSSWRWATRCADVDLERDAVRRSAERVPAGRRDQALRDVGRPARLLPAIGKPGRPAGAAHRRATATAQLDARSDAVCTALQLTNFWQDLEVDWRKGRALRAARWCAAVERRRAGSRPPANVTPSGARRSQTSPRRTRALFDAGRPVADGVRGRLRWELRATWLGGMRILDRLERARLRRVPAPADARHGRDASVPRSPGSTLTWLARRR